jgi:hypothetical protein
MMINVHAAENAYRARVCYRTNAALRNLRGRWSSHVLDVGDAGNLAATFCCIVLDLQTALNYQRAFATFTRIVDEPAALPGLLWGQTRSFGDVGSMSGAPES